MLLLYINSSTTIIKEKQHKQLELIESLVKDSNLTKRESDVLQELIKNKTNREIAVTLNITIATVKFHIGNVLQKLDVKNRVEVRDKLENVDL